MQGNASHNVPGFAQADEIHSDLNALLTSRSAQAYVGLQRAIPQRGGCIDAISTTLSSTKRLNKRSCTLLNGSHNMRRLFADWRGVAQHLLQRLQLVPYDLPRLFNPTELSKVQ